MEPITMAAPGPASNLDHVQTEQQHHQDHEHEEHDHEHAVELVDLIRIGVVALACVASWFELWRHFTSFDVIALVATLLGGYPIFKEAIANVIARRMTMELSMTIALVAAVAI